MANYSLVFGSKFRPFEYQEMLAPVLLATQAHQQLEESYADLATKSSIWDGLTEGSDKAHATYQAYAKALEDEASRLATEGLNPASRRAMLNMRSRYARDITPIENAWNTRKEQMKQQADILVKDPTRMFARKASETSLDEYIDNPTLDVLSQNYSGALLTQQVSQQAASLAKELTDYGKGKKLDAYTNTFLKKHGFTREQVLQAINHPDDPNSSQVLNAIVEGTMQSSGLKDWADVTTLRRGYDYARQGLFSAIGQSDVSTFEDKGAIMAQQLRNQQALINYQQQQQEAQRLKMFDVNPTTYYSSSEIAAKNEAVSRELDRWRNAGYFTSDGKLTNKGFEALQYTPATQTGTRYDRHGRELPIYSGGRGNYEFYQWATQHGVTDPSNRQTVNILNRYYSDTRGAISSGQLATGTANFNVYRQRLSSASDRNVVADEIFAAIGADGKIYQAGGIGADGSITRGKGINAEDFAKRVGRDANGEGTSTILHIINSPTTGRSGQQLIELANGEKYLLPAGILGNDTQANLNAANLAVRGAASPAEVATHLNRGNAYLSSILTTTTGTEIKPNDGTITIDLGQ